MSIPLARDPVLPTQCMARALYDNIAESPDELAFRRGDLLTVLEQNTGGNEGWWLCSLRGRQGICPGNRLRIVAGVYDTNPALHRRNSRPQPPVNSQPLPGQHNPAFTKIEECADYDVPRTPMPVQRLGLYDAPRPVTDWYDSPRAPRPASADSACSGTGSFTSATSSASGNSGSSIHSGTSSTYDVPRSRALPLPCDAALEALERLQDEASAAVSRLLSYVTPGWRRRGALRPKVVDVRVAGARLRAALHDLAIFADATLANAADAQDKGIAVKLRPLVKALKDAERITHEATSALDAGDWAPERLERDRDPLDGTQDALDQLVACARSLTEDVRRAASFIHGNASLLFRRSGDPPQHQWTEEYDYVRLECRASVDRRHAEIRAALPDKLRASFDALVRDADQAEACAAAETKLPQDDRKIAAYYAIQTGTYANHLKTAVEAFLRTIEMGEPPDVFLAHGKFVVLSAHKLIFVGDVVHRTAHHATFKTSILRCSDAMSDALARTVSKTKTAAQKFPCASAVHDMGEAVKVLAERALDLRRCLIRAADPLSADTVSTPGTTVPHSLATTPMTPVTPLTPGTLSLTSL